MARPPYRGFTMILIYELDIIQTQCLQNGGFYEIS